VEPFLSFFLPVMACNHNFNKISLLTSALDDRWFSRDSGTGGTV
jgi:hypothetical protein